MNNIYTFLWKGRDRFGVHQHVHIHAGNAQEARALLETQGWTGLELVMEEVGSVSGARTDVPQWIKDEPVPADQEGVYHDGTAPGFFRQWVRSLRESWMSLAVCSGLVLLGIYREGRWGSWIPLVLGGAGLAFFLLLTPVFHLWFSVPLRLYSQLNRAKVWGRWDEVLRCVERLRRAHRLLRVGVGEVELTRCRAQALAAKGQLQDGLKEFGALEHTPDLPHWLYLSHLSSIYEDAGRFEKAQECMRAAAREKPDSSSVWIGVACGEVRRLNRPSAAREALARAEALEINALGRNYLPFVRGLIAWREGKLDEAKASFEEAAHNFQHQKPWTELLEALVLLAKAHLCLVQRKLGNRVEADRLFAQVENFLVARRETELLNVCR